MSRSIRLRLTLGSRSMTATASGSSATALAPMTPPLPGPLDRPAWSGSLPPRRRRSQPAASAGTARAAAARRRPEHGCRRGRSGCQHLRRSQIGVGLGIGHPDVEAGVSVRGPSSCASPCPAGALASATLISTSTSVTAVSCAAGALRTGWNGAPSSAASKPWRRTTTPTWSSVASAESRSSSKPRVTRPANVDTTA